MKTKTQSRLLSQRDYTLSKDGYYVSFHMAEENTAYFMHYHDYYEVIFYFGNEPVAFIQDGKRYKVSKGDVVLCGMFTEHMFLCEANENFERFAIGVDFELLASLSRDNSFLLQIFHPQSSTYPVFHTDYHQLYKYLHIIEEYKNVAKGRGEKVIQRALISLLLANMYADCCRESVQEVINPRHVELVSGVVHYTEQHMHEWISLEDLAGAVNYSVAHITKVFKDITGETVNQYILKRRITHAKLLMSQGSSITQSAEASGFINYNYFYRAFKKIEGIGPREYKRTLRVKM